MKVPMAVAVFIYAILPGTSHVSALTLSQIHVTNLDIKPILSNCDPSVVPSATVRIKLIDKLSFAKLERHVEYFGKSEKPEPDEQDNPEHDLKEDTLNPFHIDVSKFKNKPSGWVSVRVVLLDSKLHFKPVSSSSGPIQGIGIGQDALDSNFCLLPLKALKPRLISRARQPAEVATFMFKAPFDQVTTQGYSIVLVPDDASDTPIVIDPKIKNNG